MDNSIFYLNELVGQLLASIEGFSIALRKHVIDYPLETMNDALRYGFPEDIYAHYMKEYFSKNEEAAEGVISFIDNKCIPYLKNVSFHLQEAIREGPGSISAASVLVNDGKGKTVTNNNSTHSGNNEETINAIDTNNHEIEKVLGIKKGPPMSIAEADRQKANPHLIDKYIEDPEGNYQDPVTGTRFRKNPDFNPLKEDYYQQYMINCATCVTAYALRLRGFDVKAKGNVKGSGSLNEMISDAEEYRNVWKNQDGSKVEIIHTDDWMSKNGINSMSSEDYRRYFEDTCMEKGVYVVMVRWKGDTSGHATILQRDEDGILYYIEPQRYQRSRGEDGRRSLDDLLLYDGESKLSTSPSHGYGVLRVDDKLFNTEYAELFEKN